MRDFMGNWTTFEKTIDMCHESVKRDERKKKEREAQAEAER